MHLKNGNPDNPITTLIAAGQRMGADQYDDILAAVILSAGGSVTVSPKDWQQAKDYSIEVIGTPAGGFTYRLVRSR